MFLSTLKEHLDKCRTFNLKQFPVPSVLTSHYCGNLLTKSSEKLWPMFNVFREVLVFQYFLWDGYCLKFSVKTIFKIIHERPHFCTEYLLYLAQYLLIQRCIYIIWDWKQINIANLPTIFASKNHLMHFLSSYLLTLYLYLIFVKNKTDWRERWLETTCQT